VSIYIPEVVCAKGSPAPLLAELAVRETGRTARTKRCLVASPRGYRGGNTAAGERDFIWEVGCPEEDWGVEG
jgi:hypothetical protein